ncbi:substrate-binding periplasmic protein [Algicola sagamiensis]|uniref:substrate-binding periplasmic protein n=1 Tax=Algicola sagamiensis TaxID=163869 RepID=UPI00146B4DD6|nr:transporter substrate-binding domain-containing protein [Algicola sagamiensis]
MNIGAVHAKNRLDRVTLGLGEYPPYHSSDLPHYGAATRIMTMIFERAGIQVRYVFFPWQRAYVETRKGTIDGTGLWERDSETIDKFLISKAVFEYRTYFFHKKSLKFDWKTIDDLRGYQIGGLIGYYYGDAFQKAEENGTLSLHRVPHESQNMKKLLLGRVQLIPISIESAKAFLSATGKLREWQNLAYHPKPLYRATSHLLLSLVVKENQERMRRFDQALVEMKSEGLIEKLLHNIELREKSTAEESAADALTIK